MSQFLAHVSSNAHCEHLKHLKLSNDSDHFSNGSWTSIYSISSAKHRQQWLSWARIATHVLHSDGSHGCLDHFVTQSDDFKLGWIRADLFELLGWRGIVVSEPINRDHSTHVQFPNFPADIGAIPPAGLLLLSLIHYTELNFFIRGFVWILLHHHLRRLFVSCLFAHTMLLLLDCGICVQYILVFLIILVSQLKRQTGVTGSSTRWLTNDICWNFQKHPSLSTFTCTQLGERAQAWFLGYRPWVGQSMGQA